MLETCQARSSQIHCLVCEMPLVSALHSISIYITLMSRFEGSFSLLECRSPFDKSSFPGVAAISSRAVGCDVRPCF